MNEDNDPYRCPTCDQSLMRERGRRDGANHRMACRTHGIVKPKYDERRAHRHAASIRGGPEDAYREEVAALEPAIPLLERALCVCPDAALGAEIDAFLQPFRAYAAWEARAAHCRWWRGAGHGLARNKGGVCAVCGKKWVRIDGGWFDDGYEEPWPRSQT